MSQATIVTGGGAMWNCALKVACGTEKSSLMTINGSVAGWFAFTGFSVWVACSVKGKSKTLRTPYAFSVRGRALTGFHVCHAATSMSVDQLSPKTCLVLRWQTSSHAQTLLPERRFPPISRTKQHALTITIWTPKTKLIYPGPSDATLLNGFQNNFKICETKPSGKTPCKNPV